MASCIIMVSRCIFCILLKICASIGSDRGALSSLLDYSTIDVPPLSQTASSTLIVHVDCAHGSDALGDGTNNRPYGSIERALHVLRLASGTHTTGFPLIDIAEGTCFLSAPLKLNMASAPMIFRGRGPATILSGGRPLSGWQSTSWQGAPDGSVFVVNVASWPVEIKSLRHGDNVVPRSRWPRLSGDGLETPNWLFAMPWSTHPSVTNDGERHLHGLGLNYSDIPPGANISELIGAYAHVLGCIENDVNSQLTKILSVGGEDREPTLSIYFRNSFNTNQRFYLENVRWALSKGEFYHDESGGKLYYWPVEGALMDIGSGSGPHGVVAPVLDRLIDIEHTGGHVVSNISFTDTTYFADGFWDGPAQQPSDAAIRINYCHHVIVEACNFVGGLGGYGVAIGNESTDITVTGSLFDSVGQGGVILYGFDHSPVPSGAGRVFGNNTKPRRVIVSHNVMQNLGKILVHVAGVALRSASDCIVEHNRIQRTPRYGLQADSFYPGAIPGTSLISSGNIFQYNILSDTNRLTTDTGAIEMLGSGNPEAIGWWNNNTIRFNNISTTVGSSSSDGQHVCVHGVPDENCRRLVWGIYLDGGEAGIMIYGNIIGATLHGAVFDNAGGNNTQMNNIFLANADAPILMDFGAPGTGASRRVAGNSVQRNIFYWHGGSPGKHAIFASQVEWSAEFLKPNGSDYNLFWSPTEDVPASPAFPGGKNLFQWQGRVHADIDVVTCSNTPGSSGNLVITENCSWGFDWNSTSKRYALHRNSSLVINIDCDGDWGNCAHGTSNTRICLDKHGPWNPHPSPPVVDNSGWVYDQTTHQYRAVASKKCMEVCVRGGDVGGCNGKAGSVVQLADCKDDWNQKWIYNDTDRTIRLLAPTTSRKPLCLAPPVRASPEAFDLHSIVADPLFENPAAGDFTVRANSPAVSELGFRAIPPITAPSATCGSDGVESCLSMVLHKPDVATQFI